MTALWVSHHGTYRSGAASPQLSISCAWDQPGHRRCRAAPPPPPPQIPADPVSSVPTATGVSRCCRVSAHWGRSSQLTTTASGVCSSHVSTVTSDHRLRGLMQPMLTAPQINTRLAGLPCRCGRGWLLLGAPGGVIHFLPFRLLEATALLGMRAASSPKLAVSSAGLRLPRLPTPP